MANKLRKQVEDICKHARYDARKLFMTAFQMTFGKRRGIMREARAAHAKFTAKGSFSVRARKAIAAFVAGFHGNPAPQT